MSAISKCYVYISTNELEKLVLIYSGFLEKVRESLSTGIRV
jgi:hypothetical protein